MVMSFNSHSPKSLNSSPVKVRSPVNLHFLSSFSTIEITNVEFQCQQSPFDNHTEYFSPRACEQALIVRRGNTIVLKITTSVQLSSTYVVSLTFVSYHRPRERFGQFRARGVARQSNELWLSISLPPNFPVGKYHTQLSLFLGGELATHFCGQAIAVLFNPWSKGELWRGVIHNLNYSSGPLLVFQRMRHISPKELRHTSWLMSGRLQEVLQSRRALSNGSLVR